MKINKNNYEAFFLDYHEGNLSPQQVAELLLFVEQHPELREEFESFENISLEDFETVSFTGKSDLKKEVNAENVNDFLIAAMEKVINPAEKELLDHFLKQHPQYQTDLELFNKTILKADTSVVFENKERLKEIALTTDHLLIASVEGLLTNQETALLNHQVAVDAEMKHALELYKKTKLSADLSVIYQGKEELKHSERKVISFYYYVAAAAAILLLFGIFSLFRNNSTEQPGFADKKNAPAIELKNYPKDYVAPVPNETQNNAIALNHSSVKKEKASSTVKHSTEKDSLKLPENSNEADNKNVALNTHPVENKEQPIVVEQPLIAKEETPTPTHDQTPAVASIVGPGKSEKKQDEFLSLGQMAVSKFKERTLSDKAYAAEKKTGRDKKLNGWDILAAVAKGVSKVTGKKVEVEHTSVGNDTYARK